jgi:hypothetical protein
VHPVVRLPYTPQGSSHRHRNPPPRIVSREELNVGRCSTTTFIATTRQIVCFGILLV